jgi:hypothetical protein
MLRERTLIQNAADYLRELDIHISAEASFETIILRPSS